MKKVLTDVYEGANLLCRNCKSNFFTVMYNENFWECGPCLRIMCANCNCEHDFGLDLELGSEKAQLLIKELKEREEKKNEVSE